MDRYATMPLPRRLHLELTNRCNSHCQTCVRTVAPEPWCDMALDDVERIVAGLPDLESVALQVNGEPLLHPHLPEVVALLKARGVWVELNTNGVALRHRRAAALIDNGLDQMNVSLDAATPQTYRRLRGVDAFGKVVGNVRSFIRRRGPRPAVPRISLWMTATASNLGELPALVELAARVGADEVYLQRLVYFGAGLAHEGESLHGRMTSEHVAVIADASARAARLGVDFRTCGGHTPKTMLDPSVDPTPWRDCRRPWDAPSVMANGDVVPCCISTFVGERDTIRMGNVLDTDWTVVWNGLAYNQQRARLRSGDAPDFCTGCGVRWSL